MKHVVVTPKLTEEECKALLGKKLDTSYFDQLFNEDVTVTNETGEVVCVLKKKAIPVNVAGVAFKVLDERFNSVSNMRGVATDNEKVGYRKKKDGSRSNMRVSLDPNIPVNGIIGYFDRTSRFPYCRQTSFVQNQLPAFKHLIPFFSSVSETFRTHVPQRWAAQKEWWDKTSPDFRIDESVFTTITVNKSFQTAIHLDAGDLKEGFSCLTVLRKGVYSGCYFLLPRYRIALNLDSCDVALIDPHEYHGNTPMEKITAGAERISCVLYYRTKIAECGSAAEELARVQNRRLGEPLYDNE